MKFNYKIFLLLSISLSIPLGGLFLYSNDAGKEGTVIVLYGTPCSGKSTLATILEQILDDDFTIVKRQELADDLRRKLIEQLTGKRLETRQELIETALSLSEDQKKRAFGFGTDALNATIVDINQRVKKGENIILDVCLSDPAAVAGLNGKNIVKVLVYTPISQLSERELNRASTRKHSKLFQQRRRATILNMYSKLYRPKLTHRKVLDVVRKKDIEKYYAETENDLVYQPLQTSAQKAIRDFYLNQLDSMTIVPNQKPDLLIDTSINSPKKGAQIVRKYLRRHQRV